MFVPTYRVLSCPPFYLVFIAIENVELEFLKWRGQLRKELMLAEVKGRSQSDKVSEEQGWVLVV